MLNLLKTQMKVGNASMSEKFKFEPTAPEQLAAHYDILVIGSGGAGLASALQATELGAQVAIFEKMPRLGGNTTRASSGMNAAETEVQLQHHVVDRFEDFYVETLKGGGNRNDPALLRYFTTHGALAINWLAQHKIYLDDLTITGGMSRQRTHRPSSMAPVGGYLITGLLKTLAEKQVPIFAEAQVTALAGDATGVTGVTVNLAGQQRQITAGAVILATGGFGANAQLIAKYRPDLQAYQTTNQPGATGDGLALAQAVAAGTVDLDQIQIHPTVQQDTDHAYLIGEAVRGEGAILVDQQGQRFVNELDTRKNVTAAIEALPEKSAYLIFDQSVFERVKALAFYQHIGLVESAADLSTLAAAIKVPTATLAATVATWNQNISAQKDPQWHRTTGLERSLIQAPFMAIHIAPAIHYTMGGLKINPQTQVQTEAGKIIPGLFAAGEVTGGLHGDNRIGGNSVAETVIFGRQAGQQAWLFQQKIKK